MSRLSFSIYFGLTKVVSSAEVSAGTVISAAVVTVVSAVVITVVSEVVVTSTAVKVCTVVSKVSEGISVPFLHPQSSNSTDIAIKIFRIKNPLLMCFLNDNTLKGEFQQLYQIVTICGHFVIIL